MADTGPPWNLPFPLPTDLVRDGADAIKDLAEATATGLTNAGTLRQIVRATDDTARQTNSSSFVDASISVTITPENANSTLLLFWTATFSNGSAGRRNESQITDASNTQLPGALGSTFGSGGGVIAPGIIVGFVSAGSTNPQTFKGRFRNAGSSGLVTLNDNSNPGQLYALEVGP